MKAYYQGNFLEYGALACPAWIALYLLSSKWKIRSLERGMRYLQTLVRKKAQPYQLTCFAAAKK